MSGRVVLVTGGAGGIGRAVRAAFEAQGDRVIAADLRGADVADIEGDVTSSADCDRMVAEAVAAGGRLDVLVCAAGIWTEGPTVGVSDDDWRRTLDVNLTGTFLACRAAIPHLVATRGCIVNVASDYGLVGGPATAAYVASKFGVNGLTRSLALELAPQGVRVNAVCPNDVDTPMLRGQAERSPDADAYLQRLLALQPQGPGRARFIRPEEVAAAIAFLASPAAEPITGACLPIDWGATAGY
ncbi:MAG: SDR family NAD(P)-dependent oxidoreductase [Actinomycetota bacterium]